MGITLGLYTLTDEHVRKVLSDPPLIFKVIAPDDEETYELARAETEGIPSSATIELKEDEVLDLDLDKAWHGIHFLLTQSADGGAEPLNFLLQGGSTVESEYLSYGEARLFTSEQVRAISSALGSIDGEYLRSRFNPSEMVALEIYPEIWDRDPEEDDTFAYLEEYFGELKAFIDMAAARGLGLIIELT